MKPVPAQQSYVKAPVVTPMASHIWSPIVSLSPFHMCHDGVNYECSCAHEYGTNVRINNVHVNAAHVFPDELFPWFCHQSVSRPSFNRQWQSSERLINLPLDSFHTWWQNDRAWQTFFSLSMSHNLQIIVNPSHIAHWWVYITLMRCDMVSTSK